MKSKRKPPTNTARSVLDTIERIRQSVEGVGPKLGADQLDHCVDLITSKGSIPENVNALLLMPTRSEYAFPRMLILRRLWQEGTRFLNDEWLRSKFGELVMTGEEMAKMSAHFGKAETAAFLKPPHLVFSPASKAVQAGVARY